MTTLAQEVLLDTVNDEDWHMKGGAAHWFGEGGYDQLGTFVVRVYSPEGALLDPRTGERYDLEGVDLQ